MEVFLHRFAHAEDYTYGLFFAFDLSYPDAFILEDEFHAVKVKKETRVPEGRYRLVLNKTLVNGKPSPLTIKYRVKYSWFKWHIMLKDVPGFTGVYMHIGNIDEHTAVTYHADIDTCASDFEDAATNDYRLVTGSDLINTGNDWGQTWDILENTMNGTPDIGAYEKQ
jgi:hypothetical protein